MFKFIKTLGGRLSEVARPTSRASAIGSNELEAIREVFSQPARSVQEMPRRIELCCRALAAINRDENPKMWAALHGEMANSLQKSPQGARAENLEQAISYYQQALTVFTREAFPAFWGEIQNNLGIAYGDRIRGQRAENLEQAVAYYQQALTVYTRETFPADWAMTQSNLVLVYRRRIRGDRAENLELAIEHAQQALTVYTRKTFPAGWANTQNNLGNTYQDRVRGDRAENLEKAIAYYQDALTVRTHETDPEGWAMTQQNLANVYSNRIRGERAENLEQAIVCYQQAQTVYTRETFPVDWAMTEFNLATAYGHRIRGEQADNVEQAIAHLQQALTVRTREADPERWAMGQHNLASAYGQRIRGERADNLDQAIVHIQQALTVFTREADPERWAANHHNLAHVYTNRIHGERADNLEQAIAHAQQALTVRTCEADPENWAMTQNDLAIAYGQRICGKRVENLVEAIRHCEQALIVYTLQRFPTKFQLTQRNLGLIYFDGGAWSAAVEAYKEAIRAERELVASAYTVVGQQAEIAQTSGLYANTAYALLKLGRTDEALLQLEQGMTRLLSRALALNEVDVSLLPESQKETLCRLRQTLRTLEAEMQLPRDTPVRRNERVQAEAVHQLRTELHEAIACIRTTHPDFMPEGLSLSEILSLVPPDAALVVPVVTAQGSAVFVIPAGLQEISMEHVLWINGFKETDVLTLLKGSALDPQAGGWLEAYSNAAANTKAWFDAIDSTGQALWTQLMDSIVERLANLGVTHVLLLPQGRLGLLPLHAAWREVNGAKRYFLDDFTVSYLPSVYAHKISLERLSDPQRHERSLLAVINPTEDLPFTPVEGEQVAKLFETDSTHVLSGSIAAAGAIAKQTIAGYVHFSCHGFYRWDDPMQSSLVLADREPLTLAQIMGQLNFDKTRLVTLSACETGIRDILESPDECLGLPAGFLRAGAPAVVSTLWAVNDLSTMLLMERFYSLHLREKMDIPDALRQAQIWLRDMTAGELAQRFAGEEDAILSSTRLPIETASAYFARFASLDPSQRPFSHPYYWAAFSFSGA